MRLAPDSYRGYSNLGAAYYFADRRVEARRAFERALEINPEDDLACANLGTLYFFEGRFAEEIEKALKIAPRDMTIQHRAAQVYHLTEQTETALQFLKRSVEAGYPRLEIAADPLFADLSGNPEFDALVDESLPRPTSLSRRRP